jgi:hypothetical protein
MIFHFFLIFMMHGIFGFSGLSEISAQRHAPSGRSKAIKEGLMTDLPI